MIKFSDILQEHLHTSNQNKEFINLQKIHKNPKFILKLAHPTNNEMKLAFDIEAKLMQYYENIPEDIQLLIVEKNPNYVKYIKNPSENVQKYIVDRGFLDYRNGQHYWKLLKNHNSISAFFQSHPFTGFS